MWTTGSDMSLQLCQFSFKAMGSPCEIRLYAEDNAQATAALQRLENRYSRYLTDNELYKINAVAAQGGSVTIDDEFVALLHYADACYQQSDGLFDITSGLLRKAWNFASSQFLSPPSQDTIDELLEHVGWQHVVLQGNQLQFSRAGMEIDLGGIVKEYAADYAANLLWEQGIRHGLVNLGGDIKAMGPHPDGAPWEIKIRDPRTSGRHIATLSLYQEGLATSGDYERCIRIGEKRYSHILSPKTGWPVIGLASVTVKAPQCVVAGSAATIAMLKGDQGRHWLDTLKVEYLAVDA